jgi:hypothetical protein
MRSFVHLPALNGPSVTNYKNILTIRQVFHAGKQLADSARGAIVRRLKGKHTNTYPEDGKQESSIRKRQPETSAPHKSRYTAW